MEWEPPERAEVVKVAWAEVRGLVANAVVPSLNVTVPDGVLPAPLTVAVKVTDWPKAEGLRPEISVVVLAILLTVMLALVLAVSVPAASVAETLTANKIG